MHNKLMVSDSILLSQLWDPVNNTIGSDEVTQGSGKVMKWRCSNNHHWSEQVNNLKLRGGVCPYCSLRKSIAGETDLTTTHPKIAAIYSVNNSRDISEVTFRNCREFLAICDLGHEYKTNMVRVLKRINGESKYCPYCLNRKFLKGFNDMKTVFSKDILMDWPKDNPHPSEICIGSTIKYKWVCHKCGEVRFASPYITRRGENNCNGKKCYRRRNIYSYIKKNIKINGSLRDVFPEIADRYVEDLNEYNSSEVSPYSNLKVWWRCSGGHIYESEIFNATRGVNCPQCLRINKRSLFENEVNEEFKKLSYKTLQSDRNIIKPYEIDIFIRDLLIGVECNGDYWHSDEVLKKSFGSAKDYHENKRNLMASTGGQLLFLWEWDWKYNKSFILQLFGLLNKDKKNIINHPIFNKTMSVRDSPGDFIIY